MRYVVKDVLGAGEVERRVYRDEEGVVYGYPAEVKVDVLIRSNGIYVLLEVKSRVFKGELIELKRIGELYKKSQALSPC